MIGVIFDVKRAVLASALLLAFPGAHAGSEPQGPVKYCEKIGLLTTSKAIELSCQRNELRAIKSVEKNLNKIPPELMLACTDSGHTPLEGVWEITASCLEKEMSLRKLQWK